MEQPFLQDSYFAVEFSQLMVGIMIYLSDKKLGWTVRLWFNWFINIMAGKEMFPILQIHSKSNTYYIIFEEFKY
jgi:hypothetical protein